MQPVAFLDSRVSGMRRSGLGGDASTTDLFLAPGTMNDGQKRRSEGAFGRRIERVCATNLHDRQAFPLGNAFLLSRFSGLNGKTQSSSRFAPEHGPHLGERPSHFWENGESGAF